MILRHVFLHLSQQKTLRSWMETSAAAKKVTKRFVAGETLEEELDVCARLEQQGTWAALDHLGENVTSVEEAEGSTQAYLDALDQIAKRGLRSTVSIKLTQFGLDLSEDACLQNVRRLAAKSRESGSRVEIDMESSAYTERTVDLAMRVAGECGCVRCCLQAYLHRTEADIDHMNRSSIPVRLCKGAYDEPDTVAFASKKDVDANYVRLMKKLLDGGAYPALATHDERIIQEALRYVREREIGPERFEFQMLYGIRRDLQTLLLRQGYHLRLYVPYGTAWYPYFMRRLAERPANIWFVARSWLR